MNSSAYPCLFLPEYTDYVAFEKLFYDEVMTTILAMLPLGLPVAFRVIRSLSSETTTKWERVVRKKVRKKSQKDHLLKTDTPSGQLQIKGDFGRHQTLLR